MVKQELLIYNKLSKELGADIQIKDFIRFNLGEGLRKIIKILLMKWLSNLSN